AARRTMCASIGTRARSDGAPGEWFALTATGEVFTMRRCARFSIAAKDSLMLPKQRLFTPGPTPAPEETLLELAKPIFYHRSAEFRQMLAEVEEDLQYVFCTKSPVVPLTSSGTGGMEAALVTSVPPGGKVVSLISGR